MKSSASTVLWPRLVTRTTWRFSFVFLYLAKTNSKEQTRGSQMFCGCVLFPPLLTCVFFLACVLLSTIVTRVRRVRLLKMDLKKEKNKNRHLENVFFLNVIYFKIKKDQATKEKALQNMSSMSSAQIVSASSLHNNKTSLSGLGLPAPVSYPPPVSSNLFALLLSDIFFKTNHLSLIMAVLAAWSSTRTFSRVSPFIYLFNFVFFLNIYV